MEQYIGDVIKYFILKTQDGRAAPININEFSAYSQEKVEFARLYDEAEPARAMATLLEEMATLQGISATFEVAKYSLTTEIIELENTAPEGES